MFTYYLQSCFVMQNTTTFCHMAWCLKFIPQKNRMTSFHFSMKNIKYLFLISPLWPSISCPFLSRATSCNPVFFLEGTFSHLRRKSHWLIVAEGYWTDEIQKRFLFLLYIFCLWVAFKYRNLNYVFRNQFKWHSPASLKYSVYLNEVKV